MLSDDVGTNPGPYLSDLREDFEVCFARLDDLLSWLPGEKIAPARLLCQVFEKSTFRVLDHQLKSIGQRPGSPMKWDDVGRTNFHLRNGSGDGGRCESSADSGSPARTDFLRSTISFNDLLLSLGRFFDMKVAAAAAAGDLNHIPWLEVTHDEEIAWLERELWGPSWRT